MKKKLCALLILLLVFSLSFGSLALAEWTEASEEAPAQESEETAGTVPALSAADEAEEEAALGLAAKPDMDAEAEEEAGEPEETEAAGEAEKPLQESSRYVTDSAGILDPQQELALEKRAAEISQSLNFYVYIVTVPDYKSYSRGDVFTCATELYTYFDLGSGGNRDGVLLLMSMRERDYALISHGFYGNYCFGDHNKDLIEEAFLDNFRRNDWSGGFSDYLSVSEDILRTAAAHQLTLEKEDQSFPGQAYSGNTYRYGVTGKLPVGVRLLIALGVPSGAALAVCSGFKSQMKTARERTTAEDYVVPGSAVLRVREDRFINRTETRTLIQSESSSSGGGGRSSHSSGGGGGFTGHSGKF